MSCLVGHSWLQWTETERGNVAKRSLIPSAPPDAVVIGAYVIQERRCALCGKLQLRSEETRFA